jgi:hypothetical protein
MWQAHPKKKGSWCLARNCLESCSICRSLLNSGDGAHRPKSSRGPRCAREFTLVVAVRVGNIVACFWKRFIRFISFTDVPTLSLPLARVPHRRRNEDFARPNRAFSFSNAAPVVPVRGSLLYPIVLPPTITPLPTAEDDKSRKRTSPAMPGQRYEYCLVAPRNRGFRTSLAPLSPPDPVSL